MEPFDAQHAVPGPHDAASARQRRQDLLEDIFERVRLLSAEDRDTAIDDATDDPTLRAELRSLLRFDGPTLHRTRTGQAAPLDPARLVGVEYGGFTLLRVIGAGGMGAVFEAEQRRPLRRVALKVLAGTSTKSGALQRFMQEADFLARLDHPNIARIYTAGTMRLLGDDALEPEEWPYFAMELVDGGRPLTRWAAETRASRRAVLAAIATACDAVGSGHRAGIAHLDLKPGNLLVGSDCRVRVIDYGIARSLAAREAGAGAGESTASEVSFAGTPQYMSPEQFDRGAPRADSRSDVYALGLILYELLAGRMPYDTRGLGVTQAARMVRETEPARLRLVDSTIPRDLEAIVAKAIAKDPDQRYGTASELADDLRRHLDDEPVLATRATALEAAARLARRHRLATSAGLLALVAVVAAAVVSVGFGFEAGQARARAEAETRRANLRAAAASLREGALGDASVSLARVPTDALGWEGRYIAAALARARPLALTNSEILRIDVARETGEVAAGMTRGFIAVVNPRTPEPYELHDLRPLLPPTEQLVPIGVDIAEDGRAIDCTLLSGELLEIDRREGGIRVVRGGVWWTQRVDGGRVLLTAAGLGFQAFDADAGSALAQAAPLDGQPVDIACSRDGRLIAVGTTGGAVALYEFDPSSRRVQRRWLHGPMAIAMQSVAVAPDGSCVLAVRRDYTIARHRIDDGAVVADRALPGGSVYDMAISPDGRVAALSSWSNVLRVVDTTTLEVTDWIGGTLSHVWGIAFAPDGRGVYGRAVLEPTNKADPNGEQTEWLAEFDLARGTTMRQLSLGHYFSHAARGGPAGTMTAVDAEQRVHEIDIATGSSRVLAAIRNRVTAIARDSEGIVVGLESGEVIVLEQREGAWTERWRKPAVGGVVTCVARSPDGRSIACGARSSEVAMLEGRDGSRRWRADIARGLSPADRRQVRSAHFLEDGLVVFIPLDADAPIEPRRIIDGAVVRRWSGKSHEVQHVVPLPDQRLLAVGITGWVLVFGPDHPQVFTPIARDGGIVCTNAAGTKAFVASRDGSLRAISVESLDETLRLDGPPGAPVAVCFDESRDELTVLSNSGFLRTYAAPPRPAIRSGPSQVELLRQQPPDARFGPG